MDHNIKEGKTSALISYLTIVGAVIGIILNSDKNNDFAKFHNRQGLGISLLAMAFGYIVGNFDSWMISSSFYICFFILWIYGFVGALSNEKREIPIVGKFFQSFFAKFI